MWRADEELEHAVPGERDPEQEDPDRGQPDGQPDPDRIEHQHAGDDQRQAEHDAGQPAPPIPFMTSMKCTITRLLSSAPSTHARPGDATGRAVPSTGDDAAVGSRRLLPERGGLAGATAAAAAAPCSDRGVQHTGT